MPCWIFILIPLSAGFVRRINTISLHVETEKYRELLLSSVTHIVMAVVGNGLGDEAMNWSAVISCENV